MRIGIVGDGQLGRMLALAAWPMNVHVFSVSTETHGPNRALLPHMVLDVMAQGDLERLAVAADVVTYESENTDLVAMSFLERQGVVVAPRTEALRVSQDRVVEKQFFNDRGIETAPWAAVDDDATLVAAVEQVGLPGILKTRRFGYDGKGQARVRTLDEALKARAMLGDALIYEGFVNFTRELSVVGARGADGSRVFYPVAENVHEHGILRLSVAPAPSLGDLQMQAESMLARIMDGLEYVGTAALELFEVDGRLVANEMAPRVHNSGHWTIEGAETSQFANHVRAIAGLPLGTTRARGYAAMVNVIGNFPDRNAVLAVPDAHWHDYGKAPRHARKIGHITVVRPTRDSLDEAVAVLTRLVAETADG
jgi:5-(carboxyamino)imidazole ribonucleotide synthase